MVKLREIVSSLETSTLPPYLERSREISKTSPQGRSKGNGVSKHNPYPETSPLSSTLIPTGAEGSQRLLHFGRSKGGAFDFSLNRN